MTILEQTTDLAGKIRMSLQLSTGQNISLKFSTQPTTEELERIEMEYIEQHLYDTVQVVEINLARHYELLKEFITLVKQNPNVNLTQYNNWLGTKTWYESSIIRFFVFKLAEGLSERAEISLTGLTESFVLGKVRGWIVDTPARKIEKVVFNI